jgi:hypothetical protein
MVYLLSLPIWNAVLPAYAYLHMDDLWVLIYKYLVAAANGYSGPPALGERLVRLKAARAKGTATRRESLTLPTL